MNDDPHKRDTPGPAEPEPTESAIGRPASESRRIDRYRLLERIGHGGMGEVWLAEQTEPVRRRVAIKLIKQGMDTEAVIARFEAERQALALMDHPSVAKIFDAGSTPDGRPYFVMEYVQGLPITEHCDRHRLSNRERLALFVQVCEGVQHAHQKAIIHRDLKPSNVLVAVHDGKPVPKVIDFGVAKATGARLTDKTMHTELGVLIGTPEYMSPEQAELTGAGIDTRTDVYSLGILLYQLLVGALPFDPAEFRKAGIEAILRKLREEEPPRPSTRLMSLGEGSIESARLRRVDVRTLRSELRGDLDWITMKALAKDRAWRYGSPNELAADLLRHVRDEPVLARPPSVTYRASRFVKRYKVGVGVAAASVAALIAFSVTTALQARRIAAEREISEKASTFLANMLATVSPPTMGSALWENLRQGVARARRIEGESEEEIAAAVAELDRALAGVNATDTALELLDEQVLARAGESIEREFAGDPRVAGRLEHTLAQTYRRLGLFDSAERHAQRSLEIRRQALGPDAPDSLVSLHTLGMIYERQARYEEASATDRQALEGLRRAVGRDDPRTLSCLSSLASAEMYAGRLEESEKLNRELFETRRRMAGAEHPDTLKAANNLANVFWTAKRYEEAEKLHRETLEIRRRVLPADDRDLPSSMHNLANAYRGLGRYDEAEKLYREAFEVRSRILGENHQLTIDDAYSVGCMAAAQGERDRAIEWFRRAIEHGYRDPANDTPMGEDEDLASLHGDPEFEALAARARADD